MMDDDQSGEARRMKRRARDTGKTVESSPKQVREEDGGAE